MSFWVITWQITLVAALIVFAFMAVWVTVFGWRDIWKMFARLRDTDE